MILCVNLNASIDKTIIVDSFQLGEIHRPEAVKSLAGGKGCNVARALQTLGEKAVVTGWVGGTAGLFIENGLAAEGIASDFVHTDFESRTCTSILDARHQVLTEIYENGDPVPPEKVAEMLAHFREIVEGKTAVSLSGSIPPGVPLDFYAQLIQIAHEANVPAFLDSSKEALLNGVAAKPFLIKPNETEVTILTGRELNTLSEFSAAASEISTRYDTIVVLSMGKEGALAAKGQEVIRVQNPPVEAKSAVGSGDCMVGGLVYGFTLGLDLTDAVTYGVAAGTANTLNIGAGQFKMDDFEEVRERVRVQTIPLNFGG
jgi:tagatose 6-phosphate kinase